MSGIVIAVAVLAWNLGAFAIWALSLIRVVKVPARELPRGWWSKLGRLLAIVFFSTTVAHLFLPVGAVVVLLGLDRARRRSQPIDMAQPRGPQLPD
jgi:hypothetical protein